MPEPRQSESEWRVVADHRGGAIVTACQTEQRAREWADMERADYPHIEVWIESRVVTPWIMADRAGGSDA